MAIQDGALRASLPANRAKRWRTELRFYILLQCKIPRCFQNFAGIVPDTAAVARNKGMVDAP